MVYVRKNLKGLHINPSISLFPEQFRGSFFLFYRSHDKSQLKLFYKYISCDRLLLFLSWLWNRKGKLLSHSKRRFRSYLTRWKGWKEKTHDCFNLAELDFHMLLNLNCPIGFSDKCFNCLFSYRIDWFNEKFKYLPCVCTLLDLGI